MIPILSNIKLNFFKVRPGKKYGSRIGLVKADKQLYWTLFPGFGIGLTGFGNLNFEQSYVGFLFRLKFCDHFVKDHLNYSDVWLRLENRIIRDSNLASKESVILGPKISAGKSISIEAGQEIIFEPGFDSEQGVSLDAKIK